MTIKSKTYLFHGDCIEIMKRLPKGKVTCILSDIPYGEVNQKSSGLRKLNREKADVCDIDLDKMCEEAFRLFTDSLYIFCGIQQISKIDKNFRDKKLTTRLCSWEKTNPSPMNGKRLWLSGSEFCVFARKPKAKFNRHCEKPIWKFPVGRSKIHPTEKPVKLMEYIIESSTNEGDTVLDFTMGSGTTGVACVNLNRNFIGIEKDEEYFKIAKERIEKVKHP